MNVLSFTFYKLKRRSATLGESYKRLRAALALRGNNSKLDSFYAKLNYNINYWKEHGRLPPTDLSKVQGKGMYKPLWRR